ncbi:afadin [Hyalella azteca]|uniref:Afadin n=1 Tax=Hyalella azteca TaxID=294128 RepID=A0A979FJI3_HYAAZ|nr:afadin [Hyalella azteca]
MRRRRAQKLEKKLQQFRSKDGGPDTGGTLKIYGSSLCPDVPYKTLLLSVRDSAHSVVKEMLEKYGLFKENPANYCLVQAMVTPEEARDGYQGPVYPQKEYILDDDECPLAILMNHSNATGSIMFHVRRRPADHGPRKRKKKPLKGAGGPVPDGVGGADGGPHNPLPVLVELGPEGNELEGSGAHHVLQLNVTEVGSERSGHSSGQTLQLFGPDIHPRHCVLAHTEGVVTVTPCNRDAEIAVNGQRIFETTILKHGCVVRFGRQHSYRFLDPQQDPRVAAHMPVNLHHQPTPPHHLPHHHHHIQQQMHLPLHYPDRGAPYDRYPVTRDPILPAVLEFREDTEESFFHSITTALDPTHVQFKLAPTYTIYMAARFRASTHYRSELSPMERAQRLTAMLSRVAALLHSTVQSRPGQPVWLAFWLANTSELLHFLKQDRHIAGYSLDAQDRLADVVQLAFRSLVGSMQTEMEAALPLLLEDRDDSDEEEGCTAHVLSILTNTMALLRRCRVNAALTIQLFSQLFHFLNMWGFNRIIASSYPNYCTRLWGSRVRVRLSRIEVWAEKQGLELAADCHLARLSQAAILLTAPKSSPEDITSISSSCFKLNSLQLRALLDKYEPEPGEPPVPLGLKESVVAVAESTADGLAREDGREVRLEEDYDLQLPFLLPEDGYSCDIVRGVPSGLAEFLGPLQHAGLCRMNPQPTSSGYWTIYMTDHDSRMSMHPGQARSPSVMSGRSLTLPRGEPEVQTLHLTKTSPGMGLSIVATRGLNQDQLGIYIKSVVPNGSADQDGRLQAGDQLLSVDGRSLVGISQERAAEYMKRTGPTVVLEVARQGAFYHGLATVLEQPSPQGVRPPVQGPRRSSFSRYEETRTSYPLTLLSPATCASSRSLFVPPERHGELAPGKRHYDVRDYGPPPPRPPRVVPSEETRMSGTLSPSSYLTIPTPQPLPRTLPPPQSAQLQPSNVRVAALKTANSKSSPNLATICEAPTPCHSSSLSIESSCAGGPLRHASERDLPSRGQQPHDQPPHIRGSLLPPHHQARMQPAKSVPALNSELSLSGELSKSTSQDPVHLQHLPPSQESFRPGYSRASSSNSLTTQHLSIAPQHLQQPQQHQGNNINPQHGQAMPAHQALRARSSQNLNESDDRHYQNVAFHAPHPHRSPHGGPPPSAIHMRENPGSYPRPASALLQREDLRPDLYRPASQRDVRLQEPRLVHLPEEGALNQGPPHQQHYPHSTHSPPEGYLASSKHMPPPTAPKPKPLDRTNQMVPPHQASYRPPQLEEGSGYRDSPPPPPPPTSTHPLLQGTASTDSTTRQPFFSKTSAWEREEKERYENRRREAARQWRDEQIEQLERQENKTAQEIERLKTLRLEREFELRAKQADEEEDNSEDDDERITTISETNSLAKPSERRDSQPESDVPRGVPRGGPGFMHSGMNGGVSNDEDRAKRADEIRRKQQELEVASEVELKLIREAQRRQEEEEANVRRYHNQYNKTQQQATQRLDSLVGGPVHEYNNGPVNGQRPPSTYDQQLNNNNLNPSPPERHSSYNVMQQQQQQQQYQHYQYNNVNNSSRVRSQPPMESPPSAGGTVKRVQFSENQSTSVHNLSTSVHNLSSSSGVSFDANANQEDFSPTKYDHNDFINEAENMLNFSPSPIKPGSAHATPGVIGAQEVYRDPRVRRLQEKEAMQAASNPRPAVPETLTFREKMKMFAAETGDPNTPKDKTKISKAQREIK